MKFALYDMSEYLRRYSTHCQILAQLITLILRKLLASSASDCRAQSLTDTSSNELTEEISDDAIEVQADIDWADMRKRWAEG